MELLHNAYEAGAQDIYVASSLSGRRYRTLTVIDDGHGIPEAYKELVFEPGVTTRHLESESRPNSRKDTPSSGAGLSLYHIKNSAVNAAFFSTSHPTAIRVSFDTRSIPERSLQSGSRSSRSNLLATVQKFMSEETTQRKPVIYYGSPASIVATLIQNRVIQTSTLNTKQLKNFSEKLGLNVSSRTVQRIVRGGIRAVENVEPERPAGEEPEKTAKRNWEEYGLGRLELRNEEISGIAAILGEAARTRYLAVGDLDVESRAGEIILRVRVYEPEEEYE